MSLIQVTKSADTNDSATNSVATQAFGASTTVHNVVTGHVSGQATSINDLTSVTDNATGGTSTYAIIGKRQIDAGAGIYMWTFVSQDVKAGATVVTGNFSTTVGFRRISAQERSSLANTGQPDTHAENNSASFGTGTDAVTSTASATTADGCVIVGYAYDDSSATIPAVGTSFASEDSATFSAGDAFRVESRTQATHGSVAATFTTAAGTDNIGVMMLALAPAAGGTDTLMGQACL